MKYLEFREYFKRYPIFSLAEIRRVEGAFDRRRLYEWKAKGYIKPVTKGFYMFADKELDENQVFVASNRVYSPSYISLESALYFYGFIPEQVFAWTAVSTRKTVTLPSPLGKMIYRHVLPRLFFGYSLNSAGEYRYKIASPEKAFLDFFYLNSHYNSVEDMEGLRINAERVQERVDFHQMETMLERFKNKALEKRIRLFKDVMDFHEELDPFFTRPNDGCVKFAKFIDGKIPEGNWLVSVATYDDAIIGYCIATIEEYPPVFVKPRYGHILDLGIAEKYRKKGAGKCLLKNAIDWIEDKGIHRIELQVVANNKVAQAFWKKMGFSPFMDRLSKKIK